MEEVLRYVIPSLFALVGTLVPAFLLFKQNNKKITNETQELVVKKDHELRDEIRLLWERIDKLESELAEWKEKYYTLREEGK